MAVLAEAQVEIYDVEQIVVRGRLTLNVLIGVSGERATIRDLLFFGWERGLNVEFEKVDDTPTPTRPMSVVTVIGMGVGPEDFGSVAAAIADAGGNIDRIYRLSRYPVVSYELLVGNGNLATMRENLVRAAAERPIDIAIQRDRSPETWQADGDHGCRLDPDPGGGHQSARQRGWRRGAMHGAHQSLR